MTAAVDIDPIKLSRILTELFPHVLLFPFSVDNLSSDLIIPQRFQERTKEDETDIYIFIQKKKITEYENREVLLREMSMNERFGVLFPKDILLREQIFDKLKADNEGKKCNVIASYIEMENEKFIQGFNTIVCEEIKLDDAYSPRVSNLFEKEVFFMKTFLVDELNKSKNLGICEHSPSSIYDAFKYYAHKQYTLIRLGREFLINDLQEEWKSELGEKIEDKSKSNNYLGLKHFYTDFMDTYKATYESCKKAERIVTDTDFAWEIIDKLFIDGLKRRQNLKIKEKLTNADRLRFGFIADVRIMICKILESSPNNSSYYNPTGFITLTGQISGQLGRQKRNRSYLEKYEIPPNEIISTDLSRKYNEDDDEYDFDPEEDKYHNIDEAFLIKESWGKFISVFLKYEFNEDEEKDFISLVSEEENWPTLADEVKYYYIKGAHNKDSLLFNIYTGNSKTIPHTLFAQKIKKALKKYMEWHKKSYSQEEKNG